MTVTVTVNIAASPNRASVSASVKLSSPTNVPGVP